MRVPLRAMERLGLAKTFCDDPFQDGDTRANLLFNSHVQLHYLTAGNAIHKQTQVIADMKPARNAYGDVQCPPVCVFDMDDDIEGVNPLNPKFVSLGIRDADGNLLKPHSELGIHFNDEPFESQPVYLWRHGQQTQHGTFDAARNILNHAQLRKMAATCHAITCTSEPLRKIAARWNPRTYVYPNSILFDDFPRIDIRRRPGEVRVLWQGGYSHFPDFYPLRGAFHEAARRLPQVKWVVFGTMFPFVYNAIAAPLVEFHPWVPFEQFHLKFGTLAFDINLAPLADTRFNHCKSAIKFYEAAALGIPTLAQNAGPYREEIIDGDTGMLFSTPDEFVDKLAALVNDADLRQRIGKRAEEWVRENRDALKTVVPLADFYAKLFEDVRGQRAA